MWCKSSAKTSYSKTIKLRTEPSLFDQLFAYIIMYAPCLSIACEKQNSRLFNHLENSYQIQANTTLDSQKTIFFEFYLKPI